jgi:hypothetical protein
MRTFEVFLNGKKVCTAGVEDDGVLTAIVSSVRRRVDATDRKQSGRGKDELRLEVGGLISSTLEHVRWQNRALRAGDEVRIRIGEAELASKPGRRKRAAPPALAGRAEEK